MSAETQNSETEKTVVFVCTGNVFRSMTAMFASRAADLSRKGGLSMAFESAGTRGRPDHAFHPDVVERVAELSYDLSSHTSRKLTQDIIDAADLIIAMGTEHQHALRDQFGYDAPLYLEIAEGVAQDMPDLPDVFEDHTKEPPEKIREFIRGTMDRIVGNTDQFLVNLPNYIK